MEHEKFIGLSVKGHYKLEWDTRVSHQIYSFDGMSQDQFSEIYPAGLLVAMVRVQELDILLPKSHCLPLKELWSNSYDHSKIIGLLEHLSKGNKVSPPFIAISPHETEKIKLAIQGGTHRYSIAKDLGYETVPILIDPENKIQYEKHINLDYSGV